MSRAILPPVICKIGGKNVLDVSTDHIPITKRKDDLFYYEIRHDAISMELRTVELEVKNYFFGSIITDEPIMFDENYYRLTDEDIQEIYKNI